MIYLLILGIFLQTAILFLLWQKGKNDPAIASIKSSADSLASLLRQLESSMRGEFRSVREEVMALSREDRTELLQLLRLSEADLNRQLQDMQHQQRGDADQMKAGFEERMRGLLDKIDQNQAAGREQLTQNLRDFSIDQRRVFEELRQQHRERFEVMEKQQEKLLQQTEQKLEQMRETVDEKLQKTLHERLSQSFETVGKQLSAVQEGLGEMRTLAQDVGGLKKVLSNVKMRGGIGEVQLAMLLEQILAPEQYAANVKTKPGSNELVEFAIRLPGREDHRTELWLPIDAKFPKEVYEQLQQAYDAGDPALVEQAQKNLEAAIRKMARDISEKYVEPPHTTDFGIMFLPFEGIYAEVVRKASLLEELQRDYKIVVTGPATLAAILNSLQMGFRTLAIQRRSSEVWQVLGAVKREFESFGGLLQKAQHNIQTGLNQLDDVMGRRTRAIQRRLRGVEALGEPDSPGSLPAGSEGDEEVDDE